MLFLKALTFCDVIVLLNQIFQQVHIMPNIECVHFIQLCLTFYLRPNISDRFPSHFIRVQIFQINFSLKNEKIIHPNSHCNFPIVQWILSICQYWYLWPACLLIPAKGLFVIFSDQYFYKHHKTPSLVGPH